MVCIDLGAAPGSWSQFIVQRLQQRVRLIAIDMLPMDALPAVEFIQGVFTEDEVLQRTPGHARGCAPLTL